MDFKKEILSFVSDKVGGIVIVAEENAEIVYADSFFCGKYGKDIVGSDANVLLGWNEECPELETGADALEWEYIEAAEKKYYKFNSALFEKDGKKYRIHQITDITEYMGLNRDITKYMSFFRKLSKFQTAVLEKLSANYYELMPMLAEYFKTDCAYLMVQRDKVVDIISFNKNGNTYHNDRVDFDEEVKACIETDMEDFAADKFGAKIQKVLVSGAGNADAKFRILAGGEVSDQKYALYLGVSPKLDRESLNEMTLLSVVKLYIENGIMQEKLVYASEHDGLTGLYNKGKYLEMEKTRFPALDSIAVFNFDVNNLKKMNDQFGHEAGDKLIIKAADSFRSITNEHVHAFRMGGDEFLVVAENVSQDETVEIKAAWEETLRILNQADDGIDCVIAVGVAYAGKEYDYAELLRQADALMYEDKKAKKKPGEEIR